MSSNSVKPIPLETLLKNVGTSTYSRSMAYRNNLEIVADLILNEVLKETCRTPDWECTAADKIMEHWNNCEDDELEKLMYFLAKI